MDRHWKTSKPYCLLIDGTTWKNILAVSDYSALQKARDLFVKTQPGSVPRNRRIRKPIQSVAVHRASSHRPRTLDYRIGCFWVDSGGIWRANLMEGIGDIALNIEIAVINTPKMPAPAEVPHQLGTD